MGVRVKVGSLRGEPIQAAPEFDDVARVAAEHAPDWKLSRMPFFRDSICVVVACISKRHISRRHLWHQLARAASDIAG